ncbi:unnamed protein product, partial [Trichogramma brassicae]
MVTPNDVGAPTKNSTPYLIQILKSSRENINWEIEDERRKFIHQVYPSIRLWCYASIRHYDHSVDEPQLDGDGKPSSRRTTPVHHAAKINQKLYEIRPQFKIYNRYDVNYTDESGLSHFHVACRYGLDDEIKKFLELGQDPNCLWPETGDSPLHLYLIGNYKYKRNTKMAEPLMRSSADLNLANKDGLTPLHIISKEYKYDVFRNPPNPEVPKILFEISDEKQQPLSVDARDKFGNTPLHLAVLHYNEYVIELLLRRGADPNSANDEGSTPLHVFFKRDNNPDFKVPVKLFFKICDEVNQSVQVDARDKLGRTPLQLAVANLWPDCIDILFERGADLSKFIFPTDSYFAERYNKSSYEIASDCRLRLASGVLAVVEKIENRGYQLKRSDASTIMKFFVKYRLFEKSSDLEKCWYNDEKFFTRAKEIRIRPGLSLDEVVRLRPEEAAKLLTYEDYWKFACSFHVGLQSYKFRELSTDNLVEKVSRGFFRSWALDPLWELIHHRLPLECCEMITEELKNEDLYNICLAAAGKRHNRSKYKHVNRDTHNAEKIEERYTLQIKARVLKRCRILTVFSAAAATAAWAVKVNSCSLVIVYSCCRCRYSSSSSCIHRHA